MACWGDSISLLMYAPTPFSFTALSVGWGHACVLKTDGTLACWGNNSSGQAPQPSLSPGTLPYGYVDIAYSQKLTMTAFNYTPPSPVFSITGTLPAGLGFMADTLSGTPTVTGIFYLAVQAMDANGFAASYGYYPLKVRIETTPPVIIPSVTGIQGTNGWYRSNVTVTWDVVDNETNVTSQLNCGPTTIVVDTNGTTLTCQATSKGGTASQSVTIKRDITPPRLTPLASPNPVFLNGIAVANPRASDAGSGIANTSCGRLITNKVGDRSVACSATDLAGNTASATAKYGVRYRFGGFGISVVNPPYLNRVKAGGRVSFNWRITDSSGRPVTNLTSASLTVTPLACPAVAGRLVQNTDITNRLGLLNLGNGNYRFNWKTLSAYTNTCKLVKINLAEGVGREHLALFRFTRN